MVLLDCEEVDVRSWLVLELISKLFGHFILHIIDFIFFRLDLLIIVYDAIDILQLVFILLMRDSELSLLTSQEWLIHAIFVLQSRHFKCAWTVAMAVEFLMLSLAGPRSFLEFEFMLLVDHLR